MVLKPDYQTFASLFKNNGGKKVKIVLLHQILQAETLALRSNDLCFYTSDGAGRWEMTPMGQQESLLRLRGAGS